MASRELRSNGATSHRGWDETIGAAHAGDPEARGEVLQSIRHYLLLIAEQETAGCARNRAGASDIVQETFVVAVRRFDDFTGRHEGELKAWLRAILRNKLAKFHTHPANHVICDLGDVRIESIPADDPSPSTPLREEEERAALARALARLPDDYRLAIILRLEWELRYQQIGDALGTTAEGARKFFERGVEQLRLSMRPHSS